MWLCGWTLCVCVCGLPWLACANRNWICVCTAARCEREVDCAAAGTVSWRRLGEGISHSPHSILATLHSPLLPLTTCHRLIWSPAGFVSTVNGKIVIASMTHGYNRLMLQLLQSKLSQQSCLSPVQALAGPSSCGLHYKSKRCGFYWLPQEGGEKYRKIEIQKHRNTQKSWPWFTRGKHKEYSWFSLVFISYVYQDIVIKINKAYHDIFLRINW